jgi:hypothetical protein
MGGPDGKRFWLLGSLSGAFTVVAWIVLGLVLVVTPVALARAVMAHDHDAILEWIQYGASGLLIFVNLIWLAQSIQVVVAIEENTRHAGYVLEKLTTLVQQVRDRLPSEPRGPGGSGVAGGGPGTAGRTPQGFG